MSGIKEFARQKLNKNNAALKRKILSLPVKSVKVKEGSKIADLVGNFKNSSIQARNIYKCANVFRKMLQDKIQPTVYLGLAGPLIAAGLRDIIRNMIKHKMVDVIVSTGAIIYQDIYQARGFKHYIGNPDADDRILDRLRIDRIYDTYVDDEKFWDTDNWIGRVADTMRPGNYSSREFIEELGSRLSDENSIVTTACKYGVPVFVPALNDSSIGIGLTGHYHRCKTNDKPGAHIDSIQDNYEITQTIVKSKKTAAIYIAGGVPKNYINDAVVMGYIFNRDTGGHSYAFQLTTDAPHWGGLSGSTLKEATSWGKINNDASHAMAFVEPSVSLPLVYSYVFQEKFYKSRKRKKFIWRKDILESFKNG
ncbi:MAG: deoxyhypusine synthase family protein [Candidatus Omnitrophota bacterium]|nr:deoxyhypusine synthase family protein [Candidatus Omnitrophota bacterium]